MHAALHHPRTRCHRGLRRQLGDLADSPDLATSCVKTRGDGHIAAFFAAGVGGRESYVLHALVNGTDAVYTPP